MYYYTVLDNLSFIRVTGADSYKFLQGLITNDLNKFAENKVLYSYLLTPQGKYVADFFLYRLEDYILNNSENSVKDYDHHGDKEENDSQLHKNNDRGIGYLIAVDDICSQDLLYFLNIYKLNADVQIFEVTDKYLQIVCFSEINMKALDLDISDSKEIKKKKELGINSSSNIGRSSLAINLDIIDLKKRLEKNNIHQQISDYLQIGEIITSDPRSHIESDIKHSRVDSRIESKAIDSDAYNLLAVKDLLIDNHNQDSKLNNDRNLGRLLLLFKDNLKRYKYYFKELGLVETDRQYYMSFLYSNLVPISANFTAKKSLILEYGAFDLNAVVLNKGCYVGQEITNRMYRLNKIRKRLALVISQDQNIESLNNQTKYDIYDQNKKIAILIGYSRYNGYDRYSGYINDAMDYIEENINIGEAENNHRADDRDDRKRYIGLAIINKEKYGEIQSKQLCIKLQLENQDENNYSLIELKIL